MIYFLLKAKKFDKKVLVDKSTNRPEWVKLQDNRNKGF